MTEIPNDEEMPKPEKRTTANFSSFDILTSFVIGYFVIRHFFHGVLH